MNTYCPTPYKDAFASKGQAREIIRQMHSRKRTSKNKALPQKPYKCQCGSVHLADPRWGRNHRR